MKSFSILPFIVSYIYIISSDAAYSSAEIKNEIEERKNLQRRKEDDASGRYKDVPNLNVDSEDIIKKYEEHLTSSDQLRIH
ncbi:uncharacterized protein LOC122509309 isoform X3 [Leptopilina heterotoma]|uniref:uncharacterized protein LOC122509309 isoform X3 n=1 Tax=Leptopilina heterotoma TaxID=63436 RepID=UPI001CA7D7FF|nr:uncharacterized protein LOC122509309 isoform X3 [Leptopilina heterotoma]